MLLVECRPAGLPVNVIPKLYDAARGENPITYEAARAITALPEGSKIAVITGIAFKPHLPKGEIDGPIGAVVLGRALARLGHTVDVLVQEEMISVLEAVKRAAGADVNIVNTTELTQEQVNGLADVYDAAVTIEKLAKNPMGIRHSIMGTPLQPEVPSLDELLSLLNERNKLTIGIGDGGNDGIWRSQGTGNDVGTPGNGLRVSLQGWNNIARRHHDLAPR